MAFKFYTNIKYIFFVFCFQFNIAGQSPTIKNIQQKDGLSGNIQWSDNAVAIDKNGFIWFATNSGLNRWDGYTIKSYTKVSDNKNDLPGKILTAIAIDKNNNIWLGTHDEGIIFFNTKKETFQSFDFKSLSKDTVDLTQINHLLITPKNELIIASAFQGLHKYNIETKKIYTFDKFNKDCRGLITSIFFNENSHFVISSSLAIYYLRTDNDFEKYPIVFDKFPKSIVGLPDKTYIIHITNKNSYYHLDLIKKTLNEYPTRLNKMAFNSFVEINKNVWTSYPGIITKENFQTKELAIYPAMTKIYGKETTLGLTSLLTTNEKKTYFMSIGAGGGVIDLNNYPITTFLDNESANLKVVDNALYFTQKNALFKLVGGKKTLLLNLTGKHLNNYIIDYLVSCEHGIWVSHIGQRSHLSNFDLKGNKIGLTLLSNGVSYFSSNNNNEILVEINNLAHSTAKLPFKFVGNYYSNLSGKSFPDIAAKYYRLMKNGDIWIATSKDGIYKIYDNYRKYEILTKNEPNKFKLKSNNAYYFYELSNGEVYACTDIGINVWKPKMRKFQPLNLPKNISNDHVHGMIEDNKKRIWILLNDRILCYEPFKKIFYTLPLSDHQKIEAGTKDLVIDQEGNIYFEGYNGIFKIEPEKFFNLPPPKDIIITELYVNRVRIMPGDEYSLLDSTVIYQERINVPYKYRDLGFSFVSVNGEDHDLTYYYRVNGYQNDWIETKTDRSVYFTNLDPGDYSFEVKAISGNGKSTAKNDILYFTIMTPWYQRWYSYFAYALVLSSLAYLVYKYRVNQILKYQNLRVKISSDLHDDVGTILTGIAMQSENLSFSEKNEDTSLLLELSNMCRDAIERMRDIVWALDARKDNYDDLILRMKEYAGITLGNKDIPYFFNLKISSFLNNINPEERQNIYLIFKEAISNIVKHSNSTRVDIRLIKTSNEKLLIIKDNGTLIAKEKVSGQGLMNMKMRASRIGGQLVIDTNDGFEVKLIF